MRRLALLLCGLTTLVTAPAVGAQAPTPADSARLATYERREVMIPMRDGVKLHTFVFTPKDQQGHCHSS